MVKPTLSDIHKALLKEQFKLLQLSGTCSKDTRENVLNGAITNTNKLIDHLIDISYTQGQIDTFKEVRQK